MALKYPSSAWDPGTNASLSASAAFIGLATVTIGSGNATINADVNLVTLIAGEDLTNNILKVNQVFTPQSLTSLVTVTPKSGAGLLHNVFVGSLSGPTIEFYDNTAASGTLLLRLSPGFPIGLYPLNYSFSTGLTINPQPGTAVLPNITVGYR